jgi:hypothetical protein
MLLYIITEYNSKVTFLSIQKKLYLLSYRIIQMIHLYVYYLKIRKKSYLKLEIKYTRITQLSVLKG